MTTDSLSVQTVPALECQSHDDPRVVHEAATEDYSLHVVPRSWRLGKFSMAMAWSSLLTAVFWLIIGASVALAVGTRAAVIGLVLSVIVYGAINYVFSKVAIRSGLTVALMSRGRFGYYGASLATLVFAAGAIYFATFEGSVLAIAFQAHFGGSMKLWYAITVLYSLPLVLGGVRRWLDKLNAALLPIFAVGLVGSVIWAIADYGYSNKWQHFQAIPGLDLHGPGWMFAFTAYMGVWLIMFYTVDFARFGREKDAEFNSFVTFGPVFYVLTLLVNALVGIFLAGTLPFPNGVNEVSLVVGIVDLMGISGLVFIFVTQTKINSANMYLASTNLESFFARAVGLRLPRWVWVVVTGVAVFLFMLTNMLTFLLQALGYQAVVVVAWVAIALVELAFRRAQSAPPMEFRPGRAPQFYLPGLVAWTVASAVGITLIATSSPIAGTWGAPLTFVIAATLYAVLRSVAGEPSKRSTRPFDPRLEVSDEWETRVKCHECTKFYIAVEMDRDPTSGHQAICAACASGIRFLTAARRESLATRR